MPATPLNGNAVILSALRKLLPPLTLVHVGAGHGAGPLHQWQDWDIPEVWLIDAVPGRLAWTKSKGRDNWHVLGATLDEHAGERSFHHASNPDESSLIDPTLLRALWPGLASKSEELQPVQRLDALLALAGATARAPWLFVDCLPALPILKGAGEWLEQCSVLWLRVLLKPVEHINGGATHVELDAWLQGYGFRCVDVMEGNHPALGHALFVRDWQQVLAPKLDDLALMSRAKALLEMENLALSTEQRALQEQVLSLTGSRDEQARLAFDRQKEIEQLTEAGDRRDGLIKEQQRKLEDKESLLAASRLDIEKLVNARDEQRTLAVDLGAQVERLNRALDEQTKLAVERQSQIAELTRRRDELRHEKEALVQTKDLLENQIGVLVEQQQRDKTAATEYELKLQSLLAKLDEQGARERQLSHELDKQRALAQELVLARDELSKAAEDRQAQLEHASKTAAAQAQLVTERQIQIVELTKRRDELKIEKDALIQGKVLLDKEIKDLKAQKQQSENQAREMQTKLQALSTELVERTANQQHLATARDSLQNQVQQLVLARDELKREVDEVKSQRDHARKLADEQSRIAGEVQTKVVDLTKRRDELKKERDTLIQGREQLDIQINELKAQVQQSKNLSVEASSKIETLQAEKADLQRQLTADLVKHKAVLEQLKSFNDTEIAKLRKAMAEQARVSAERQQHLNALTERRDELQRELSTFKEHKEKLEKQNKDLKQQLEESKNQLKQSVDSMSALKIEMEERDARQHLLNDEVTRAEAQIELIKDILLRESGL